MPEARGVSERIDKLMILPESSRKQIQFILDDKSYNSDFKVKFISKYGNKTKEYWLDGRGFKEIAEAYKKDTYLTAKQTIELMDKYYPYNIYGRTITYRQYERIHKLLEKYPQTKDMSRVLIYGIPYLYDEFYRDCKELIENYLPY